MASLRFLILILLLLAAAPASLAGVADPNSGDDYAIIGGSRDMSLDELKSCFRQAIKTYHQGKLRDRETDPELWDTLGVYSQRIIDAWQRISNGTPRVIERQSRPQSGSVSPAPQKQANQVTKSFTIAFSVINLSLDSRNGSLHNQTVCEVTQGENIPAAGQNAALWRCYINSEPREGTQMLPINERMISTLGWYNLARSRRERKLMQPPGVHVIEFIAQPETVYNSGQTYTAQGQVVGIFNMVYEISAHSSLGTMLFPHWFDHPATSQIRFMVSLPYSGAAAYAYKVRPGIVPRPGNPVAGVRTADFRINNFEHRKHYELVVSDVIPRSDAIDCEELFRRSSR